MTLGENLNDRLFDAVRGGHTETVKMLLVAGADVHAVEEYALRCAVRGGHTETVKMLLVAGADVHAVEEYALRCAASSGHTETAKILLAAGADVHVMNDLAIRVAAFNGHTDTVKVLAKHIFAPDSWRGKNLAEIQAQATALYDKITLFGGTSEGWRIAGMVLADCTIDCWQQARPAPPKLRISPLPAQPRPV